MPYNPKSNARMSEFLKQLAKVGVIATLSKQSIYDVNGFKISIRTTTKENPKYWYDVSENIMNSVDYFIYQMDSDYSFIFFPSVFFKERYEKLKNSNREKAKIFYLDWKNKTIVSNPSYEEDIQKYCCSTEHKNSGNWHKLLTPTQNIKIIEAEKQIILDSPNCFEDIEAHKETFAELNETERKRIIDSRVGQNIFRKKLINKWNCCSVTGCNEIDILIASHIKPWSASNNAERLDVNNGLLLIPNLDSLFDKGYITFKASNGLIYYSSELTSDLSDLLGINKNMAIKNINEGNSKYLDYHNKYVFKS